MHFEAYLEISKFLFFNIYFLILFTTFKMCKAKKTLSFLVLIAGEETVDFVSVAQFSLQSHEMCTFF